MPWNKHLKLGLLVALLGGAVATYYISQDEKPAIIFAGDTTYYIPGKNKRCDWIAYIANDVTHEGASFSEVHIGLPAAEKRGSIRAIMQVHENIALLSYNLSNQEHTLPVVMTGDISNKALPIQAIRFRWLKSSLLTVPFFATKADCLATRVKVAQK